MADLCVESVFVLSADREFFTATEILTATRGTLSKQAVFSGDDEIRAIPKKRALRIFPRCGELARNKQTSKQTN
jgi:hypothetical protein